MKTNTSHKLLPLFGSQFEVDRPPFLPSSELTAPIFWRSPLPLRAAIWQWVAIWYLSAPPGGARVVTLCQDCHYGLYCKFDDCAGRLCHHTYNAVKDNLLGTWTFRKILYGTVANIQSEKQSSRKIGERAPGAPSPPPP